MLRQYLEEMGSSATLGTLFLLLFLVLFVVLLWRILRLPADKAQRWGQLPLDGEDDKEGKK
jgi:hypothetical protein